MFSVFFPMHNVPLSAFITKGILLSQKIYTAFCIMGFISGLIKELTEMLLWHLKGAETLYLTQMFCEAFLPTMLKSGMLAKNFPRFLCSAKGWHRQTPQLCAVTCRIEAWIFLVKSIHSCRQLRFYILIGVFSCFSSSESMMKEDLRSTLVFLSQWSRAFYGIFFPPELCITNTVLIMWWQLLPKLSCSP